MCGICGKFSFHGDARVSSHLLEQMCEQIRHRGPDDQGMYITNQIGLGMRRLSIIDLQGGHQPIYNEDKSIWVVFNGEIYNFMELRDELERNGHCFLTNSDTEVIVHAYETYGLDCLGKFRGMFAFALWDENRQRLILARDRLGKKPLYYSLADGALLFGSEIKSILQERTVTRSVNLKALDLYLTFQYVPAPLTIFEGIYKLPPASVLMCEKGTTRIERYWSLDDSHYTPLTEEDYSERLLSLLRESVKLRMISDVPLGAFLSGGIDSSIVVALMAEHSPSPIKTFSIGFTEEEFSELKYARMVAEHFGTEHHEMIVMPDITDIIPKLAWHYNEPFGDSSAVPTYYLSEMTRQFVTVALSGDGGDELFAGYTKYPLFERMLLKHPVVSSASMVLNRFFSKIDHTVFPEGSLAGRLVRSVAARTLSPEGRNFHWMSYYDESSKRHLYSPEMKDLLRAKYAKTFYAAQLNASHLSDPISRILMADLLNYLPDDLLVKVDIASMANSLEVRCPFLDSELVEFAVAIPWSYKVRNGDTKSLLKKTFSKLLPPEILRREKQGFAIPIDRWFRTALKDYAYDTLLCRRSTGVRRYFDIGFIERMLNTHASGKADYGRQLWLLLNFAVWHQTFIE
ncbi:MAG: asparagine synthase (glutamine-hydrolyzing) [Candidatus Binatia bacterium]